MIITRYGCAVDGVGLTELDPSIIVTDIQESAPALRAATAEGVDDGLRLLRLKRPALSVAVTFEVHEYDPARRKAVALKVCGWAREGWLTLSDRPGQRLRVVCDRLPAVTSALRWTEPLTVGFVAYGLPYWQESRPATAAFTGREGSVSLSPAGTADCFLEAAITAREPVDALTLTAGGRTLTLRGLGMRPGDALTIGYEGEAHRQYLRVGERSALGCRSADSADDLLLCPRKPNPVGIAADGTVSAALRAHGLWL